MIQLDIRNWSRTKNPTPAKNLLPLTTRHPCKPPWNESGFQLSAESFCRSRVSSRFYNQDFVSTARDMFESHHCLPQQPLVQYKVKTNHCILKDTDRCSRNPCTNGVCVNERGSFRCLCRPGYTGRLCDEGKASSCTLCNSIRNSNPDICQSCQTAYLHCFAKSEWDVRRGGARLDVTRCKK